jgi:hypothetical protein
VLDQLPQRAAGPHDPRRQTVHCEIAAVAHDDAALRVEHDEALRHVVERGRELAILRAGAPVENTGNDEQRGDAQACDQHRLAGHGWGRLDKDMATAGGEYRGTIGGGDCDMVNICFRVPPAEPGRCTAAIHRPCLEIPRCAPFRRGRG